jgi:3-phenylpropionate/trans-cinnamate dioxygenase ferredoxin component
MTTPEFQPCLPLADLGDAMTKAVNIGGEEIVLCQSGGKLYAIANRCSHADEPLACGRIRNGWIACPAHGGRFDLETGEAVGPPATEPIPIYPVRVVGEMIEVAV